MGGGVTIWASLDRMRCSVLRALALLALGVWVGGCGGGSSATNGPDADTSMDATSVVPADAAQDTGAVLEAGSGDSASCAILANAANGAANGTVLWAQSLDGVEIYQAVVDSLGDVVVIGGLDAPIVLAGKTIAPATDVGGNPSEDVFLAKFDPSGKPIFATVFGDGFRQEGFGVAVDAADDIYITGFFNGSIDFPGTAPGHLDTLYGQPASGTNAGPGDVFVAKLDPMGQHLWSKSYGSTGQSPDSASGRGISIDPSGAGVVVGGVFTGHIDFLAAGYGGADDGGAGAYANANGGAPFVAKLTTGGDYLWSRVFLSPGGAYLQAQTIDSAGNVYVGGEYMQSIDFTGNGLDAGAGVLTTACDGASCPWRGWVAELDPGGNHRWSATLGSYDSTSVRGLAVDPSGHVAASAYAYVNGDAGMVDATHLTMVSKLVPPSTVPAWTVKTSDALSVLAPMLFDSDGSLFVADEGYAGLDAGVDASAAPIVTVLQKLDTQGNAVWARTYGASASDGAPDARAPTSYPYSLAAGPCANDLVLGGLEVGPMHLDALDGGTTTIGDPGTYGAFLARVAR
jgi:hypothetical protein